jgi:hypothetical protein
MLLTFGATNCKQANEYIKNQPNGKKKIIFLAALSKWILEFSKFLCRILFNQMHYMNIAKHRRMHYLSMKEN